MKLGHANDEITYVGDQGMASVYRVILESRPVMDVLVDLSTGAISLTKPGSDDEGNAHPVVPTKGVAKMTTKFDEGPDGDLLDVKIRVDKRTVYAYVLPRLHVLIARVYVPLA